MMGEEAQILAGDGLLCSGEEVRSDPLSAQKKFSVGAAKLS
jgi:hypothetical protein